ncbi:MAG: M43 family zinc metalloprotease [Bacteroidia bacterium]
MKKQLSTIAMSLALMGSFMGFSQSQNIQPCNTYAAMEEYFATHPEARVAYEKEQAKLQKSYLEIEQNQTSAKTAAVQYTIPIVFHILHLGGAENITDAQCMAAVAQMNKDYNRLGSDTGTIFAPFKSSYISSDIKFMLAHKDPNGNCTSGIEHIYDARTNWSQSTAGSSSAYYNGIAWDPTKYLNVIIVKQIVPTGTVTGGGIIVGYTYIPGTFPNTDLRNSIIYNYGFLSGLNARSLSHEAGHWLSLKHTFGNTNNPGVQCGSIAGGDGIADTPDTKGNFSTCPASSTNTAYTCTSPNPTNSANYYQNVENIMDYSSCPKNFTTGQTNAMRNCLQSTVGGRNNVVSAANLTATDVNGLGNCAPIAEFLSTTNSYTVCAGGSLNLKDFSYNGTITSYSWSATSGVNFAAPTASYTGATFTTAGTVSVTLVVTGPDGTSSKTRSVLVINAGTPISSPYSESFEGTGNPPSGWSIVNPDNGTTWAQTNSAAYTGVNSYYIDGFNDPAGQTDYLYMPTIDILNHPNDTLTFKYAYARYSTSNADVFKVQASKDCGGTWGDIYAPSTAGMASASGGVSTVPFSPSLSQWVHINLTNFPNWSSFAGYSSVWIRFAFTESTNFSGGNNFYLDDINFSGSSSVGMKELAKSVSFGLYPNPTGGEAVVKFRLDDASNIKVEVMDVVGKRVIPSTESNYTTGEHSITLNTNKTLSKGIYFVCLSVNGAKITKKLIIE